LPQDKYILDMAKAVTHWLSYEHICGRSALFSEPYLRYPIGEYMNVHFHGNLKPETPHPSFNSQGPGRHKCIDYTVQNSEDNRIQYSIECKWISRKGDKKHEIFSDLLRIQSLPKSYNYIIIAGFKKDFVPLMFESKVNTRNGRPRQQFFTELFGFKGYDKSQSKKDQSIRINKNRKEKAV